MTGGPAGEWLWDPPEPLGAALLLVGTCRGQVQLLMWQQLLPDTWGWRSPEPPGALPCAIPLSNFLNKKGIWAWVVALRKSIQGSMCLRLVLGNELHLKENIYSAEVGGLTRASEVLAGISGMWRGLEGEPAPTPTLGHMGCQAEPPASPAPALYVS